ncbi:fumarylacetoacetate hydrolase family protein [Streptomyces sp. NBC_00287]|uniref:2-keto-4-pentenoate hydratase n=1 Tax=Streptomyces sp. NBC_00287 TaxID=2975702 RepID=UPI002E28E922|nr:fumarylacetoacetate hydrolase family protein [Streptomyces sp. NBC_00287]
MTLTDGQRAEAARLLREAEHRADPVEPLSALLPGLDVADAYAVQQDNIARRLADGASVVGHKVGLTAPAMQRLLGVDEPDFGHLLDDMVHRDGSPVLAAHYCRPRVEPEICFRLARPLGGPGTTVEDVLAATDAVAPALEIVDSRIRDWRITLVDTVADNASSAGLVCGPWTPLAQVPDLAEVVVDLVVDGERVDSGSGREVLGHPAAAVAWLANTLAEFGTSLEPGQVILPGAMTTAPFVTAGQKVEARFSVLGPVLVTFV